MDVVEANVDRSSVQRQSSRLSLSKASLRRSAHYPKPPSWHVSALAPASVVTAGHSIHSGTIASRSESALHARSPVTPVHGNPSWSTTSLQLGPPLSPIPYTKPLPALPPSSPPTFSPPLPGPTLREGRAPPPPHSPSTNNLSPFASHDQTHVPRLSLNLNPSSSNLALTFSPIGGGASTASPSTIGSGCDDDLEAVGGSPISSAGEPMSPITTPLRPAKARAGQNEKRPGSFEDRPSEMIGANGEEMRVTHILSRRVSSLLEDLEKREIEVEELNLELEALRTAAASPQRREAAENLRTQREVIRLAAGLRRRSSDSLLGEPSSSGQQLHLQPLDLQELVRAKDAQIAELEQQVFRWKDDVDKMEQSIARLCDFRQDGIHNVWVQDQLTRAFDDVVRTLADSEILMAGLTVKKVESDQGKETEPEGGVSDSSASSEEGSIRVVERCATCIARPAVESTDFLARNKDLEARIAAQAEDIRLYKLDVKGYKKDIRERDAKIRELQHSVLSLQARLGEKEGQVLLSDVPLGIDFGGSLLPPERPHPLPSVVEGSGSSSLMYTGASSSTATVLPQTPEPPAKTSTTTAPSLTLPDRVYSSRPALKAHKVATPPKFDAIMEEASTPTTGTIPSQPSSEYSGSEQKTTSSPSIVVSNMNVVGTSPTTVTGPSFLVINARADGSGRRTSVPPRPQQLIIPRKSVGAGQGGGNHSAGSFLLSQSPTYQQQQLQQQGEGGRSPTDDTRHVGSLYPFVSPTSSAQDLSAAITTADTSTQATGNEKQKETASTTVVRYPTGMDINKGQYEDPFAW